VSGKQAAIRILEAGKTRGFAFGMMQEGAIARLAVSPHLDHANLVQRLDTILTPFLSTAHITGSTEAIPEPASREMLRYFGESLLRFVAQIQEGARVPVSAPGKIMSLKMPENPNDGSAAQISLAFPSLLPTAAVSTLGLVVQLAHEVSASSQPDSKPVQLQDQLENHVKQLRNAAPRGNNAAHMLRAALDLDIPTTALPHHTFQLGWGSRARLFDSTSSDATSMVGVAFAQNKIAATALMRQAGVPVPVNSTTPTLETALTAGREIGFPLVVKPVDQERGTGVTINIDTEKKLAKAFQRARKYSPRVMVEKQVSGREFRLLVVKGKLFWAFERVPASVTGDGRQTVSELIEAENAERRNRPFSGLSLAPIELAEDAHNLLELQDLSLDSVPQSGQFVRLQIVPRVDGGGQVVPVFDEVHPDNAAVACRATSLARLDIAGIDFLTPDVSRSWREVGGYITEINAQPQFSPLSKPDIYHDFLKQFMDGNGRIPVALVIGPDAEAIARTIRTPLAASGLRAGIATASRVSLGDEDLALGAIEPFTAGEMLKIEPRTDLIVVTCTGAESFGSGIPFDKVDVLIIADSGTLAPQTRGVLKSISQHLSGPALALKGAASTGDMERIFAHCDLKYIDSGDRLAEQLCDTLLKLAPGGAHAA